MLELVAPQPGPGEVRIRVHANLRVDVAPAEQERGRRGAEVMEPDPGEIGAGESGVEGQRDPVAPLGRVGSTRSWSRHSSLAAARASARIAPLLPKCLELVVAQLDPPA